MKENTPKLVHTIFYYVPLLERYAMRIVKDEAAAAKLVLEVLEDQYVVDKLAPSKNLRNILKTDLVNRCHYWNQSKLFDRSPGNIPYGVSILS